MEKILQLELFYATRGKKIAIRAILYNLWKKGPSEKLEAKGINDVENPGTANELVEQNCFRRFKEGDTNLKDKPRSGHSVFEDEALFEMTEQQPSTSTHTLLAELGPSQNTINRHL